MLEQIDPEKEKKGRVRGIAMRDIPFSTTHMYIYKEKS